MNEGGSENSNRLAIPSMGREDQGDDQDNMSVNFNKSIKSQIIRKDLNNTLGINNEIARRQNTLG